MDLAITVGKYLSARQGLKRSASDVVKSLNEHNKRLHDSVLASNLKDFRRLFLQLGSLRENKEAKTTIDGLLVEALHFADEVEKGNANIADALTFLQAKAAPAIAFIISCIAREAA